MKMVPIVGNHHRFSFRKKASENVQYCHILHQFNNTTRRWRLSTIFPKIVSVFRRLDSTILFLPTSKMSYAKHEVVGQLPLLKLYRLATECDTVEIAKVGSLA